MKRILIGAGIASLLATSALAQSLGASIAKFDDNFLTVMRNGMVDHAAALDGVELQVEDANDDIGKQIDQVKNFVASGVDATMDANLDTVAGGAVSALAGHRPLN